MAPPLRRPWPATFSMLPCAGLLAFALVAGFVVVVLVPGALPTLALVPDELAVRPWSALTYSFVHAGPLPLLVNLAVLLLVAPRLESRIGGLRLAAYYGAGAVLGLGLAFADPAATTAGAAPAMLGLLVGFARRCPDEPVMPPLGLKGRWPVALLAVAVLAPGLPALPPGLARGLTIGILTTALLAATRPPRRKAERQVEAPNSHFNMPGVTLRDTSTPWDAIDLAALHEVNRSVVEVLLVRARELGPSHLTPSERELLDRMASAHGVAIRDSGLASRE